MIYLQKDRFKAVNENVLPEALCSQSMKRFRLMEYDENKVQPSNTPLKELLPFDFELNLSFPSLHQHQLFKDAKLTRRSEISLHFGSVDAYKEAMVTAMAESVHLQIQDTGLRYHEKCETCRIKSRDLTGNQDIEAMFRAKGIHLHLGCILR
jgi:hypothetical protein